MANVIYRVDVIRDGYGRQGGRILRGMSVEVIHNEWLNSLPIDYRDQEVLDAFYNKYGVDLEAEGLASNFYLRVEKVNPNGGNNFYRNNYAAPSSNSGCGCLVFVCIFVTSVTLLLL